jgi:hypothetical protein
VRRRHQLRRPAPEQQRPARPASAALAPRRALHPGDRSLLELRRLLGTQCRTFVDRPERIAHRGACEVVRLATLPQDVHLLDLLLQFHEAPDERLRTWRTAGDVDVDGDEAIDALRDGVGVVRTAAGRARTHGDDPLRVGHLVPEAADDRGHLLGDGARDDHQVGLARRGAKDFRAEAGHVVTGIEDGHHLDGAAGEAELHRPERRFTSPIEEFVDGRRENVRLEAILDQTHVRTFLFQA